MIKLYSKSELTFALAFIGAYIVLFSTADSVSESVGMSKIITAPVGLILSLVIYIWLRKNRLTEKYGLCVPSKVSISLFDLLFAIFILSVYLW